MTCSNSDKFGCFFIKFDQESFVRKFSSKECNFIFESFLGLLGPILG